MTNLYFTICAFFIALLITIMFFSKENIKNKETVTYKYMIISGLIDCICMMIVIFTAYKYPNKTIVMEIFNRIDFISYIIWAYSLLKYTYYITYAEAEQQKTTKFGIILNIVTGIFVLLILVLPMNIYTSNNAMYADGSCVIVTYVLCALYAIMLVIILGSHLKKVSNRKYLPLLALIILAAIALIVNRINPSLLIIPAILQYINLIMYFTIENPDIKLLTQVEMAKDKAEKANAAKTDFLSSMSHEIRTPLNAIVGFSEAIVDEEDIENIKNDAKDIIIASQNLLEIVNGILDISKIEAGKMEIVNTKYNLKEECLNLSKLVKPRIGEKPIELRTQIAPDIPDCLYGDKSKMKEVISNLLTNAVKYTEKGTIDFTVNCINKNNECSLIISVEDTGRGIKPEKIEKLFNKFERLDEDRNTTLEGTGLGLAITKKLIEMMGGKIVVQSVYGSGSKFTFYLKQKIVNNPSKITLNTPLKETTFIGKRILIVDDNQLNIKVTQQLLKKYKLNIDSCESGFECLEKINSGNQYDLILMDDMMPKLSGVETFHKLQENPNFKIKTVVLTANAIEGMKEKYIEEGFNDYLPKPIDKNELDKILQKYLSSQTTKTSFEPLPDELFEISDTAVLKINKEK